MSRIPRTLSAVILSTALLVAVVPAAQARPLQRSQTATATMSWFDMALAWLSDLIVGSAPQAQDRSMQTKTTLSTSTSPSGGATPMTGSCIDPNGCTYSGGGL